MYAEKKHKDSTDESSRKVMQQIKKIKVNRHWGQPYVRVFHPVVHSVRILTHVAGGLVCVFDVHDHPVYELSVGLYPQRVANWYARALVPIASSPHELSAIIPDEPPSHYGDDERQPDPVSTFLSSYVPIVSPLPHL